MAEFSTESTASTGVGRARLSSGYSEELVETLNGSAVIVATPPVCIECLRPWLVHSERWRLKVTDDVPRETVSYCPECATREFG